MSSALGVAAVTAALRLLILQSIGNQFPLDGGLNWDNTFTVRDPSKADPAKTGLNLFMYMVTPSPTSRNDDLPAFTVNGGRRTKPTLALDLHYLLTAYGTADFDTEILLALAMQAFSETPILTPAAIQNLIPGDGIDAQLIRILETALVEQINVTPQPMTTEELARLWTAFQAPYQPSAIYRVATVLVISEAELTTPLPVLERHLAVETIRQPVILGAFNDDRQDGLIVAESDVAVTGRHLRGEHKTQVEIDNLAPQEVAPETATRLTFTLPPGLEAGPHSFRVRHVRLIGPRKLPRGGIASAVTPFMLHPTITVNEVDPGGEGATIATSISPSVGVNQRATLEVLKPRDDEPEVLEIVALADATSREDDILTFTVSPLTITANLRYRVRVDNAESPLEPAP